jgi:hypothetical protein
MAKIFPYDSGYMQTVVGRGDGCGKRRGRFWQGMADKGFDETFIPRLVIV